MLFPALLITLALALEPCVAGLTPVIDLGYARYRGTFDLAGSNNTQFLGIRFAAPPTGSLRWQAPRTPGFVAGIQNATAEPPRCLQGGTGQGPTNPFPSSKRDALSVADSEDCLFLNVYIPGQLGSRKNLPVVIWIHGGGYDVGGANGFIPGPDLYNGNDLIRDSGDKVIVVVIQYRLGLFGFLAGASVKAHGALNAGLLDQQFAFQWVQEHVSCHFSCIVKFGGDLGRVTIWGQSAGAGSVIQQVIANDGNTFPPLFRAAITSSSFLPSQYAFNDVVPEFLFNTVVARTKQVINIDLCGNGFFGTFVFVLVVDGNFIKQRPTVALREGKVNGEVLMSVTNTNEGALFVDASTAGTVQVPEYLTQLFPNLSAQNRDVAVAKYSGLGTPIEQVTAIMGELSNIQGQFAIPPAGHGDDVPYYFPSMNANGVPPFNNTAFDKAFTESFLAFVVFLDPNDTFEPTITPTWNRYSFQEGRQVEIRFNKTESGDPAVLSFTTPEDLLDRCS
ncbi:Alpha/Beta hydrolase protein [Armillaria fumosa]|nr:Alpha/Beta hydrolase protein [Armillaria fumosa]